METPNYPKWAKREKWTLWEAAYVVGGIEPVREPKDPQSAIDMIAEPETRERVRELYEQSKDARGTTLPIAEASRTGWVGNKRVNPAQYIEWAKSRGFEIPPELAAMASQSPVRTAQMPQDADMPEFPFEPRPLAVPANLLALDPETIVKFAGNDGEGQSPSHERAENVVAKIEAQIKRQSEGYFTVNEAAQILADMRDGADVGDLIRQMRRAFEEGTLQIREWRGLKLPHSDATEISVFLSLVKAADIKTWLSGAGVDEEFPNSGDDAIQNSVPIPRQRHQEEAILRVIDELGYLAKALPKSKPGKKGVKAEVRANLRCLLGTVFDKAWQRLRDRHEII